MKHWKVSLLILIVLISAIYVDLDKRTLIKFQVGKFKFNKTFERPPIDLNILGLNFSRNLEFKRGLDLAGGTYLVMSADMTKVAPADRDAALESLQGIIERRINLLGVSEPVIQTSKTSGEYRLIVEIAGVTDTNEALNLIGKTAELVFREEISASESAKVASESAQKIWTVSNRD